MHYICILFLPDNITIKNKKGQDIIITRQDRILDLNPRIQRLEYLTVYFLKHGGFTDAESWMADVARKTGNTGIYYGEGHQVTYED